MRFKALGAVVACIACIVTFVPVARADTVEEATATALFNKINNGRVKRHNLQPVKVWDVIVTEAQQHSAYQAQRGVISHDGFDARAQRIEAAGTGITAVCENVASVSGAVSAKQVVRIFYHGWDTSPPHHACLFDQEQRSTWAGVGIAHVGSSWYATYIAAQDTSPSRP